MTYSLEYWKKLMEIHKNNIYKGGDADKVFFYELEKCIHLYDIILKAQDKIQK